MERIVRDLINRLETQKEYEEKIINEIKPTRDNPLVLLCAGKIFAYDFCIQELRRILEYSDIKT